MKTNKIDYYSHPSRGSHVASYMMAEEKLDMEGLLWNDMSDWQQKMLTNQAKKYFLAKGGTLKTWKELEEATHEN